MKQQHVALIAGVTGAIGSALARELSSTHDWKVLGVSRRKPTTAIENVAYLNVDMNDPGDIAAVLGEHTDITHVFYCGRATHGEQLLESAEDNLKLLHNLVDYYRVFNCRLAIP